MNSPDNDTWPRALDITGNGAARRLRDDDRPAGHRPLVQGRGRPGRQRDRDLSGLPPTTTSTCSGHRADLTTPHHASRTSPSSAPSSPGRASRAPGSAARGFSGSGFSRLGLLRRRASRAPGFSGSGFSADSYSGSGFSGLRVLRLRLQRLRASRAPASPAPGSRGSGFSRLRLLRLRLLGRELLRRPGLQPHRLVQQPRHWPTSMPRPTPGPAPATSTSASTARTAWPASPPVHARRHGRRQPVRRRQRPTGTEAGPDREHPRHRHPHRHVALRRPTPTAMMPSSASWRPPRTASSLTSPADARVHDLQAQADANPGCVYAKNLVAQAAKDVVDAYRAATRSAASSTSSLPAATTSCRSSATRTRHRSARRSTTSRRSRATSASEASLRSNYVLGQDAYGSSQLHPARARATSRSRTSRSAGSSRPRARSPAWSQAYLDQAAWSAPSTVARDRLRLHRRRREAVKANLDAGTGAGRRGSLIDPYGAAPADRLDRRPSSRPRCSGRATTSRSWAATSARTARSRPTSPRS